MAVEQKTGASGAVCDPAEEAMIGRILKIAVAVILTAMLVVLGVKGISFIIQTFVGIVE